MNWRGPLRKARRATWRVGYARARLSPPVGTKPPVFLAVCAVFRDEAAYLREWVSFHELQGVERFYLYNHMSADSWQDALAPFDSVDVRQWDDWPVQQTAYSDCLRRHRTTTRWIAFIDVDEFLYSPTGMTLPEVLRDFDGVPGVVVNWRCYGTSGHEMVPEGSVVQNYAWRAADDFEGNAVVKSIVYPRKTASFVESPHSFRHWGTAVDENQEPHRGAFREARTVNLLRINHYYAKSREDHARRRVPDRRREVGFEHATGAPVRPIPPDDVHDPLAKGI